MNRFSRGVLVAAALLVTLEQARPVAAAESAAAVSPRSTVTVVTDMDTVAPGMPFHAALRIRLAPGWHSYWLNPGDAGLAPVFDLQLPGGANAGSIQWPVPKRIAEGDLTTYAYTGDVLLPRLVTPGADAPGGGRLSINAHAEWLACRDICVPEDGSFELSLPLGIPSASPQADLIKATLKLVPTPPPFLATIDPKGVLTLSGLGMPADVTRAEYFPTSDGVVESRAFVTPEVHDGALTIQTDPGVNGLVGRPGIVVLSAEHAATAYTIDPTPVAASSRGQQMLPLLVLAVLGGLLLNLMPCVFPILAMKGMALARMSGANARRVRSEAVSYSAGVIVSFIALGLGLIALRSVGELSGWGFQFQSPVFVIATTWLLFAIGLNLSGVFTVGESLMGRGAKSAQRGGHIGSFVTGMLAVVVASPCTAPFMGAAVAGALALPVISAVLVFAALGAGLALPYAAIAFIPGLPGLLPKPGQWMQTVQQLLAFPMYAAAVWLLWVASQQAGSTAVLSAGCGLVIIGLAAWLLGATHGGLRHVRVFGRVATGGLGLTLALLLSTDFMPQAEAVEPFTTARLEQLRAEGNPVFVNITAAWCLSCLVNERIALAPAAVQTALKQAHVAMLKGDWTSKSPAIAEFLHRMGQDGVPLYVFYRKGHDPLVLPQLLTENAMLNAIAQVGS